MRTCIRLWTLACSAVAALPCQSAPRIDLPEMLRRQARVDWLWKAPAADERCVQFSSYDRRSDRGPDEPAAWYANNDRGHYLRVEQRDGAAREYVMVDVEGPGCLVRLWSANPSGTIHFDVDGTRVWTVDFAQLCSGRLAGVPEPLAGMRARGGNVYLPILFGKQLVVSTSQADLYYLADVARMPRGSSVEAFHPDQLKAHADTLAAAAAGGLDEQGWASVWHGDIPAGSLVRWLAVRPKHEVGRTTLLDVLRRARLVVRCGKVTTVDVPLTAYFAAGPDWTPWQGALLGVREDGAGYSRFPMPFPDGGAVDVEVDGDARGVRFDVSLSVQPSAAVEGALRFRADYHLVKAQPTRPFSDHRVLDARGVGRFVGCSLLVRNPSRIWWGEGDEKLYVDGEAAPSWFGTGTEDYFGYAWCDPTPFTAPFHAQVRCDGPLNFGFTQLHRTHVLDSVPFQRSLRFDLERWHWVEDAAVDYETVAYWYGSEGASSGLPAVPAAAARTLPALAPPAMLSVEGALEGETLPVLSCSGGTHEVQNLAFFEGRFSRDAHRWWRDGAVGDALVLGVPVAAAGRYKVSVVMTRADDFGRVQLSLGGTALGAPFDGYAETVQPSARLDLGEVTLKAGEQPLRLQLVGKNPKAKERMMVGLDYLILERVR